MSRELREAQDAYEQIDIQNEDDKIRFEELYKLFVSTGHISPHNLEEGMEVVAQVLTSIDKRFHERLMRLEDLIRQEEEGE